MKGDRMRHMVCNVEDSQTLHCLTANATVSCARCGAKAHSPSNVCDPVALNIEGD